MGYVTAAAHGATAETGEELDEGIACYKIFSFDGEEEIKKNVAVGEHHTERQENTINSA